MKRTSVIARLWSAIALCGALLFANPSPGAEDFDTLLARLGSESFADKESAVAALGGLGDARAVAALEALAAGKLVTIDGGKRVAIGQLEGEGFTLVDPVTGGAIGSVSKDAAERIKVNNRLRGAIESALAEIGRAHV